MSSSKAINFLDSATKVVNDPLNFLIDNIIRMMLAVVIPLPIPDEVIILVKAPLLQMLITFLLIGVIVIVGIVGIFIIPFTHPTTITAPTSDTSFTSTDTPSQNPFGGSGLSFVRITAYFHDQSYYAQFGTWHPGLDMVPSDAYYTNSSAYNRSSNTNKDIIIFASMDGTVNYFQDQYGANTVIVTNKENTIQTMYLHFNKVFVTTRQVITAGTPVGTMGDTGFSTGAHVHYQINVNNNGSWTPVDPLGYITK